MTSMTCSSTRPGNCLSGGIRSSSSRATRIGAVSRPMRMWVPAPSSTGMPSTTSFFALRNDFGAAGFCPDPDAGQLLEVDVGPPPRHVSILDGPCHPLARRRGACSDGSPVDGCGSTACCAALRIGIRGVLCTTLGGCWVSFLLAMPFVLFVYPASAPS